MSKFKVGDRVNWHVGSHPDDSGIGEIESFEADQWPVKVRNQEDGRLVSLLEDELELLIEPRGDPIPETARGQLLDDAKQAVCGDRDDQYGDPEDSFERVAQMWNAYLGGFGFDVIQPGDVAAMLALLKIARIAHQPGKRDNWLDLAGYAACGWAVAA